MKQLIICFILVIFNTTMAQNYKSLELMAPEFREEALKWTDSILDQEAVRERLKLQAELIKKAPPPSAKITVPAEGDLKAVNLYLFKPKKSIPNKKGVILYFHGGGYLFGSPLTNAAKMYSMANTHNALIVAVEYSVNTYHQASLNDAYQGLKYIYYNAEKLGIDKNKIVLMGESAGGGLAARLALYARDMGEIKAKAQVLIYPMLDYRTGGENCPYNNPYAGEFVWNRETNQYAWSILKANQELRGKELGYFSPSMAEDLSNLPETFILVGSLDLFVDEDKDYAQRLKNAGVNTELHIISGVFHAYKSFLPKTPQAKEYNRLVNKALKRFLK